MSWQDLLDDIDSRLAQLEQGLLDGRLGVSAFALPEDLGPLPPELRLRAELALRRSRALEIEVQARRERTAEALRRRRTTGRPPALYLDRSA